MKWVYLRAMNMALKVLKPFLSISGILKVERGKRGTGAVHFNMDSGLCSTSSGH
jgi:hypothetical protein